MTPAPRHALLIAEIRSEIRVNLAQADAARARFAHHDAAMIDRRIAADTFLVTWIEKQLTDDEDDQMADEALRALAYAHALIAAWESPYE